jgi:hypothetical protein
MGAQYPRQELNLRPSASRADALPLTYAGMAVLTGFEPVISTLTEWRGLRLPYKTMALAGGVEPPHFGLTVRCPAIRPREIDSSPRRFRPVFAALKEPNPSQ